MEHKHNGANFLEWSKFIRVYLQNIDKDDHLTCDPPKDDKVDYGRMLNCFY